MPLYPAVTDGALSSVALWVNGAAFWKRKAQLFEQRFKELDGTGCHCPLVGVFLIASNWGCVKPFDLFIAAASGRVKRCVCLFISARASHTHRPQRIFYTQKSDFCTTDLQQSERTFTYGKLTIARNKPRLKYIWHQKNLAYVSCWNQHNWIGKRTHMWTLSRLPSHFFQKTSTEKLAAGPRFYRPISRSLAGVSSGATRLIVAGFQMIKNVLKFRFHIGHARSLKWLNINEWLI